MACLSFLLDSGSISFVQGILKLDMLYSNTEGLHIEQLGHDCDFLAVLVNTVILTRQIPINVSLLMCLYQLSH